MREDGMNEICDVAINGGKVCRFNPDILESINIGIRGDKIISLSKTPIEAKEIVDASNRIVAPGFIDFHSHVDGKQFSGECMIRQGATTTIGGEREFDGIHMRYIYNHGFIINQGYYISHSFTLRKAVGIVDPYASASNNEISLMVELSEEFLRSGALGIHFGLEFVPGTSRKEITSLALVARKYNKPILIHSRKDGHEALNSLNEIIDIAKETKVAVHILHLEYMLGYENIMPTALHTLHNAIDEGVDITADTGIYDAFPAYIGSSILNDGWKDRYREGTSYEDLVISSGINAGKNCNSFDFEYLRNMFPKTLITAFVLDKKPILEALAESFVYVSTNAADGPHYEGIGHPETAGTFPRLIKKYVREEALLDLLTAIKKCTYLPAIRFGVQNKGNICRLYDADIVVFYYEKIADKAQYINKGDPNKAPEGIEYVIVNGSIVIREGKLTNNRQKGKLLNKKFML